MKIHKINHFVLFFTVILAVSGFELILACSTDADIAAAEAALNAQIDSMVASATGQGPTSLLDLYDALEAIKKQQDLQKKLDQAKANRCCPGLTFGPPNFGPPISH
jgi:hypothetical protein